MKVDRQLGVGGFATVWNGVREIDGAPVAVKVAHSVSPIVEQQFRAEASVLQRVGPPWVPRVYEQGSVAGRSYIVMERLGGHSLADELAEARDGLSFARIREAADALLTAVAAVHSKGVLHRDLKPENVFLVGEPLAVRLIDFGLTGETAPAESDGSMGGTVEYMAPEQLTGKAEVGVSAEVYALGVMLFELLTLRLPFVGEGSKLRDAHVSLRPRRPSDLVQVPPAVDEVLLTCLKKTSARRYASVELLRQAFGEALRGLDGFPVAKVPAVTKEPAGPSAQGGGSGSERVVAVFMTGATGVEEIRRALAEVGGTLAHVAADKCVGVLSHRAADQPVDRTVALAQRLSARGLLQRALVDVMSVRGRVRPDGSVIYMSPAFSSAGRYPPDSDPLGVTVSNAARSSLVSVGEHELTGVGERTLVGGVTSAGLQTSIGAPSPERALERFVGRRTELDALVNLASEVATGGSSVISLVVGPPGIGKSRLQQMLVVRVRKDFPTARVWEFRGREPLPGEQDLALTRLLSQIFRVEPGPTSEGRAAVEARLGAELAAEVFPGVALAMGWLDGSHPEIAAVRAAPGALRSMLARAVGEGIRAAASSGPLFLLIDDAHWLAEASLDGLEQVSARDSGAPVWVSLFARPSLEQGRPNLGERAAAYVRVEVPPMPQEMAEQLCRQLLKPAEHVPQTALDVLVGRTDGNPRLLVNLIEGLKRDGLVRQRPGGGGAYLATEVLERLPDLPLVDWLASREVEALPPTLVISARLASQLSVRFFADEYVAIADQLEREAPTDEALDPEVGLARLKVARVLLEHRDHAYSFANPLMRDTISASVPEAQRKRVHGAALDYYRHAALAHSVALSRIAHHAALAGEPLEAAAACLELAEEVRGRHSFLEAELLYSRALGHLGDHDQARQLIAHKGRGIMRYRISRYEDSIADFLKARELAQQLRDLPAEADVLLDAAMALDWIEEWRQARQLVEEAAKIITPDSSPRLRARLTAAFGFSECRFMRFEEGIRRMYEAVAVAETLGDEGYELLVSNFALLGFSLPFLGRTKEAEAVLGRLLALCLEKRDELHLFGVYNNRACLWIALDEREKCLDDMAKGEALAKRLGMSNGERNVYLNRSIYLYWRGELEAAEREARRVIELDVRRLRDSLRPDGTVLLARIKFAAGELQVAKDLVESVKKQQEQVKLEQKKDAILFPNDAVLLSALDLAVNDGSDEAWKTVVERAHTDAQGQELIELLEIRARAATTRGARETALATYRSALEVCERMPNVMTARIRRRVEEFG